MGHFRGIVDGKGEMQRCANKAIFVRQTMATVLFIYIIYLGLYLMIGAEENIEGYILSY